MHLGHQEPYAVLSRTNATLFHVAVELMRIRQPFLMIGGVDSYNFGDILDTARVLLGQHRDILNPFLRRFESGMSLRRYAEATDDSEILSRLKVIQQCGGAEEVVYITKKLLLRTSSGVVDPTKQRGGADIAFLGTIHKAKGLEFDNVVLANDYISSELLNPDFRRDVKQQKRGVVDEFNMVYVGVTRAKRRLRVGDALKGFLLKSGMLAHVSVDTASPSSTPGTCTACGYRIVGGDMTSSTLVGTMWNLEGAAVGDLCPSCMSSVSQFG